METYGVQPIGSQWGPLKKKTTTTTTSTSKTDHLTKVFNLQIGERRGKWTLNRAETREDTGINKSQKTALCLSE